MVLLLGPMLLERKSDTNIQALALIGIIIVVCDSGRSCSYYDGILRGMGLRPLSEDLGPVYLSV